MFAFFKRLFSADARVAALEKERDFYKAQAERESAEKKIWEKRYFAEMTGNRRREDKQAEIIRNLMKVPAHLPERAEDAESVPEKTENGFDQPKLFVVDEQAVLSIANQFREQNPQAYPTDESFEFLCQKIRENPDMYF